MHLRERWTGRGRGRAECRACEMKYCYDDWSALDVPYSHLLCLIPSPSFPPVLTIQRTHLLRVIQRGECTAPSSQYQRLHSPIRHLPSRRRLHGASHRHPIRPHCVLLAHPKAHPGGDRQPTGRPDCPPQCPHASLDARCPRSVRRRVEATKQTIALGPEV